jgi:predicted kinase
MEKVLFLLRGLPGAGKSTLAKSIGAVYFDADMFFMEGNEYKFDIKKIRQAHEWCQNQVKISMKNAAGGMTPSRIAVANTFTQEWEMQAYYDMAKEYGFTVFALVVENRHGGKNVHDVPADVLDKMEERFELKLR